MKKLICIMISICFITSTLTGCGYTADTETVSATENLATEEEGAEAKQEIVAEETAAKETNVEDTTTDTAAEVDNKQYELTFASLQNRLNEQRKQELTKPLAHTIEDYGIIALDDPSDFTPDEIEHYSKWVHYQFKITREEALADTEELFRLLKNSYAGYNYFGGDDKFTKAKERIIERVNEVYSEVAYTTDPFYQIVKEELAFIEDSRFRIGRSDSYFEKKCMYYDMEKRDFTEDENGFGTTIGDRTWYVSDEDEQYVYPTVNDQGMLVYGLFCMVAEDEEFPRSIRLVSDNGEECTLDMTWSIVCAGPQSNDLDVAHEHYDKDNIPVTTLTRMSLDFHDVKMTNEFVNEAKELKDEHVFILDLRDNTGGVNEIADFFLYNLTGDKCEPKVQLATRYSAINQNIEKAISETKELSDFSELDFYKDNQELVDSWTADRERGGQVRSGETVVIDRQAKWNDYENIIVVLVNQKTKAAAEYFLMKLSTVSNVVIIGTNTAGYMITDSDIDAEDIYLQYTGIPINYGPTLVLHDRMEGFDKTGWIPDIVTRGDALEAAAALLKN